MHEDSTPPKKRLELFTASSKRVWVLLLAAWTLAPSWSAAQIVGDANSDGLFDAQDVSFVATLMRHGSQRPYPMADVAAPCNGIPDPVDGLWLQGARILLHHGRGPVSRCHGETVGSPLPPPPEAVPWVTLDDLFSAVARQVPEFGGLYVQGDQLHLVLTDPSPTVHFQAVLAVEDVFGSDRFEGLEPVATLGDFDFTQLRAWKEAATPLLTSRRVVSLDANERSNRITLGLEDPGEGPQILALAQDLGIPTRAIELRPSQLTGPHVDHLIPNLQSKVRPLVGGLGIGLTDTSPNLCTLGFLAKWYGIARGFLTNAHCLAPIGQEQFVDAFQDEVGNSFSDHIGTEAVDPPLQCGGTCRLSDATFVELDSDETGRLGWVAAAPNSPPADPYFGHYEIVSKGEAVCGEVVYRIGRTTGQAAAEVEATCVGLLADWSTVAGIPVGLLPCQHRYQSGGQDGDSGGPVLRRLDSEHAELVGIHWGGFPAPSDAFSPLSNVEAEIGELTVTVSNEIPEVLITAPPTGTHVGSGALVPVHLEAAVFDFEQGGSCSGCSVSWASTADGALGVSPFSEGTAQIDATLSGASHSRVVTADAIDDLGATSWDFVILHTDNTAPQVWIDWPMPWANLWSGVPYTFQGSSFDSETFQALPCSALEWMINGALSTPVIGCHPIVVFPNPGLYSVTLQGEDSFGAMDGFTVSIQVSAAPPDAPPVVTFLTPSPGAGVGPATTTALQAIVTLPGGGQDPITVEWTLESSKTIDPSGVVSLGGATVFSGDQSWQGIVPQDYLQGGCGATAFSVRVTATDTGSQQVGEATLDLDALWPPC